MTLALAVTDNADGTGVTATVSGSDGGGTVTLYSQSADGNLRTPAWASRGTRLGDGAVVLGVPAPGLYWFYATAPVGGAQQAAPPVFGGATDGTLGLHERILQAVLSRLASLTFAGDAQSQSGISGASGIYDYLVPFDRVMQFPCLVVTIEGTAETLVTATNARDDYGYPVAVAIVDRNDSDWRKPRPKYTRWRTQIQRAFENQRLPGVSEVYNCAVQPNTIIDPQLLKQQYVVSGMILRFLARQTRGLT